MRSGVQAGLPDRAGRLPAGPSPAVIVVPPFTGQTHAFQACGRRTDRADLPEHKTGFFMRTPAWCASRAQLAGPACAALVAELLSVNALFRLRQAQGVLRLGQKHGDARLEAACRRALAAGDPSYRTVKGILAAGTEHEGFQPPLPGIDVLAGSYLGQTDENPGPRLAGVLEAVRARTRDRIAELHQLLLRIDEFEASAAAELAGRADFRARDPHFPHARA
jgi:hypothetical protein